MKSMKYEVIQDKLQSDDYRVEAINSKGECYVAIFSGPLAKERAEEYAAWKFMSSYQGLSLNLP